MRVVVVGAAGQLGAAVAHELRTTDFRYEVVPLTRADLDVSDGAAVHAILERLRPDAIVNAAAYNDVDGAEDRPIDALTANAFAVRALARAADRLGAVLVHYSSDFVFDGTATAPYTEDDPPSPRSVYAASKMLGEWFALDAPHAYVLRVESLFGVTPGGPPPKGSVAAIVAALASGRSPKVFEDRTVSPTYIPDAARATRLLMDSRPERGIYHCVNTGLCTWLEFAQELVRQMQSDGRLPPSALRSDLLTPVKMADVPLRAQRPQFCALANDKLRRAGIDMPTWQDAVARFVVSMSRPL